MKNFNTNNTQNIENQAFTKKVQYLNDQNSPFTLYCSHLGYLKGFNRVVDAFNHLYVFADDIKEIVEENGNKVYLEIIEHLEEHGKKDKVICKIKASDVNKKRYDNI